MVSPAHKVEMGAIAATYALAGLEVNLFAKERKMVSKLFLSPSFIVCVDTPHGDIPKSWLYPATSLGVTAFLLATKERVARGFRGSWRMGGRRNVTHNLTHVDD
jgi:hypothetical protein